MARFFKFNEEDLEKAKSFTASEWRLFNYLRLIDPFGDQYHDLDTLSVLSAVDIKKTTFYKAIAKFQELGLFDFQDKGFNFRSLGLSAKTENFPQKRKTVQENGKPSAKTEPTIYTEDQILSDYPKGENEFSEIPDPEPVIAVGMVTKISQTLPVKPISLGKDKFSEARTISVQGKNVRQRNFNWLPDGPWNIEDKLDPNFRDWLANNWLKQYGGDIHSKRADVLAHFKKDPANLPIRWEQYQGEYLNRFENAQILLNNGVEIKPEYQYKLINNQRAITQSLPCELNPCAQRALGIAALPSATAEPLPITRGLAASVEPLPIASLPSVEPITRGLAEGVEPVTAIALSTVPTSQTAIAAVDLVKNEDGQVFKVFKAPKPIEEPITPEQWEETRAKIAALTGNFKFGKSSPRNETPSKKGVTENTEEAITLEIEARNRRNLEELNQWINDPILRSEAMKKVMLSDCYKCLFDEEGNPYQVIYCEEF